MENRRPLTIEDKLRAIELDPDLTWAGLQLHIRNTERKIRKLLVMEVKTRSKRKSRPRAQTRQQRNRSASTLV
jgi:hypothetical protein